ncbi:DUF3086 domain-containing protein [Phormidium tenue FACHB-886]|nr:DUF3086 domain-containing protein [Phormidium tenue FACHB-886]
MSLDTSFTPDPVQPTDIQALERRLSELRQQENALKQELAALQRQVAEAQQAMGRVVKEGLSDLEQRRQTLQISIEQLERRQERIRTEMKTTFAGTSQDLAIRVQGFKDYLAGSLQDLVTAVEQLPLTPPAAVEPVRSAAPERAREAPQERRREAVRSEPRSQSVRSEQSGSAVPRFTESEYQAQAERINKLLDQYRLSPDYYGAPWRLRRTFEPVHAERVSNWFFTQGGRGALKTMGSRLQNILIASAIISVLKELQGDRLRVLVLGNSPERLGEWRRGLQDCLGISRADFGSDQGVVLFDAPEPLAQRADRLVRQKQLPLILVDESEGVVDIALLQFPLWLAFAPDPANPMIY